MSGALESARRIFFDVVDDNPSIRVCLVELLRDSQVLHFHASYASGAEALAGIPASPPNLVLMDIRMPGMSGIECTRRLKRIRPNLKILMLTALDDRRALIDAFQAGASGFLLKDLTLAELDLAARTVLEGGSYVTAHMYGFFIGACRQVEPPAPGQRLLTSRENAIMDLDCG